MRQLFNNAALLLSIFLNMVTTLGLATITMAFMSFVILRAKWQRLVNGEGRK